MKDIIKNILKEEMISKLSDWRKNISTSESGEVLNTLISIDDETGDRLYLVVGFNKYNTDVYEYSYSFIIIGSDGKPLTGYETERSVVRKMLPKTIVGNKQIFPVIEEMTRMLLDNVLPMVIYRKTAEKLKSNNSLKRYEVITDIMVNEYGYELVNQFIDKWGFNCWKLIKKNVTDKNKTMNEEYLINADVIGINECHSFSQIKFI